MDGARGTSFAARLSSVIAELAVHRGFEGLQLYRGTEVRGQKLAASMKLVPLSANHLEKLFMPRGIRLSRLVKRQAVPLPIVKGWGAAVEEGRS